MTQTHTSENADPHEIAKFDALAHRWWDPKGEFRPLHELNPLRLKYIHDKIDLTGKRVLDVGCGGGILAESMAHKGACVTGIDMAESPLAVAKLHLLESGVEVDYQQISTENMAKEQPGTFDVVTCMELLEHVPDPLSVIQACYTLVKPGGHVFFSTINRNPKAYMLAIVGAEYVLKMLPKGTHDYAKFIRPSELAAWVRHTTLELKDVTGIQYHPLTKQFKLSSRDVSVNYMMHTVRPMTSS